MTWEQYYAERCDASTEVVPREQDHGVGGVPVAMPGEGCEW